MDIAAREKKIAVNERKTISPIHRDFITILRVKCHVSNRSFYAGPLNELGHGSSSFSEVVGSKLLEDRYRHGSERTGSDWKRNRRATPEHEAR